MILKAIFVRSSLTRTVFSNRSFNNQIIKRSESTTSGTDSKEHDTSFSSNTNQSEYFDIVICGGGMVGSAMAHALGKDEIFKHLKIAMIEPSKYKEDYKSPLVHSNRVCALSDSTVEFFKKIGTFEFIEKNRFGHVKNMHVWDGSSDSHITFNNNDGSNVAIIVENDLIQASLTKSLPKFENIKIFYSNKLNGFDQKDQLVNLKLNDNLQIKTKLLIGSDGVNSFIREKANFKTMKWDYDQIAIVATMKLSQKGTNNTAWQRFLSTGPIALLPLNDEFSSLVWSIKKSQAQELLNLSNEQFASQVNHAFVKEDFRNDFATNLEEKFQSVIDFVKESKLLPQIENLISEPISATHQLPPKLEICMKDTKASYPLGFLHSNNYVKDKIVLIGDAVHRIHPLAGQGVNLGFGDVICLTEILKENVKDGAHIGSDFYLKKYESKRQKEAFLKVTGIDILNKLYTDFDYPIKTPLIALRSVGLTISNRILPLKDFFQKQAMK